MSSSLLYPLITYIFLKTWGKGTQKNPTTQTYFQLNSKETTDKSTKSVSTKEKIRIPRSLHNASDFSEYPLANYRQRALQHQAFDRVPCH